MDSRGDNDLTLILDLKAKGFNGVTLGKLLKELQASTDLHKDIQTILSLKSAGVDLNDFNKINTLLLARNNQTDDLRLVIELLQSGAQKTDLQEYLGIIDEQHSKKLETLNLVCSYLKAGCNIVQIR